MPCKNKLPNQYCLCKKNKKNQVFYSVTKNSGGKLSTYYRIHERITLHKSDVKNFTAVPWFHGNKLCPQ